MKICIYGLGAIGGFFAARLAAAGITPSAVARGATLTALRERGLVLRSGGRETAHAITASSDPAALGPQDFVFLTVKTTALETVCANIAPLLGPDTVIVSAMNGVPWWFFQRPGRPLAGSQLKSIDPHGHLARALPAHRVIGGVVHASASVAAPGVVNHATGQRLIVGEVKGVQSARLDSLVNLLRRAGLDIEVTDDIQREIWYKLWGNMTMNPIAAITGATVDRVLDDPLLRGFATNVMREAAQVGERIGIRIAADPEERHQVTRRLGAFKPSTLQDVEAGRPLELDALLGAPVEIAALTGVDAPLMKALFGLARLRGKVLGLYPS